MAATVTAGGVLLASPVVAQSIAEIRELVRSAARDFQLGDSIQGLTAFSALPGVSAARFTIDQDFDGASDATATKLLLPLSHEFQNVGLEGLSVHTELTLGYMRIDQDVDGVLAGTPVESSVDMKSHVMSAIGGVGVGVAVGSHTTVRPMVLLGYSRIEQDTGFSGPGARFLDEVTQGFMFNYTVNEALIGGALEIADQRPLASDLRLTGNLRYNHLYGHAFATSDPVLDTNSDFGVLTALAELDGPTGTAALGRELRWIGFVGHSYFSGESSRAFDFDYFFELGGGLEVVDRAVVEGIEGVSLRMSGVAGNGIYGWNVGLKLEF